jgi:hypothetical protein
MLNLLFLNNPTMTIFNKIQLVLCVVICSTSIQPVHAQSSAQAARSVLEAKSFTGKLDQLLTLEMAAEISGYDASQATKEHGNDAHKAFGGEPKPPRECFYLWDNGREATRTVAGNTITYKTKDRVGINSVSNTTLERFTRSYPVLSAEQKTEAQKQLAAEQAKQNHNNANPANPQTAQMGAGMIRNLEVEEIQGVGEAARWYSRSNELKVFYRGLGFAVVVDVSADVNVNRSKAIALAQIMIEEQMK